MLNIFSCVLLLLTYIGTNIGLSLIETNIIDMTSEAKGEQCSQIYTSILFSSLTNFIFGIIYALYCVSNAEYLIVSNMEQRNNKIMLMTSIYCLGNFLKNMWIIILYSNLTTECAKFYENEFFKLMILFYTETAFGLICGLINFLILLYGIYMFYLLVRKKCFEFTNDY